MKREKTPTLKGSYDVLRFSRNRLNPGPAKARIKVTPVKVKRRFTNSCQIM